MASGADKVIVVPELILIVYVPSRSILSMLSVSVPEIELDAASVIFRKFWLTACGLTNEISYTHEPALPDLAILLTS